ncbi:MAG: hypothetical protein ACYC64_02965 [Armatimonadota bacterium]
MSFLLSVGLSFPVIIDHYASIDLNRLEFGSIVLAMYGVVSGLETGLTPYYDHRLIFMGYF